VQARRGFLAALATAFATPLWARLARADQATPTIEKLPTLQKPDEEPRTRVLFVVIDRPEDARIPDHGPNVRGLRAAVGVFDPAIEVTSVTIHDLAGMDEKTLDATYRPLAIIGAGSFSEWYQYGVDADWKSKLDHWMAIIRTTKIPMLAICGSHQLVAIAFNGFSAVAHMTNDGKPIPISNELALVKPRGLWPNPRVGEEGTYPIAATVSGSADPLARALASGPMAAAHHKDMVVDTTGFVLLYQGDDSRQPATRASDQVQIRCKVQAMKRDDPSRILYCTQFHPEMQAFDESTAADRGFGATWVSVFLGQARAWWNPSRS